MTTKSSRHCVALVLLVQLAALPVGAATIHVEKDGSGDYMVIQDAVDAAAVGDTILIGPGQYLEYTPFTTDGFTENTYMAVTTDSLTIRGSDRNSVIIGPDVPDFTTNGPWGITQPRETRLFLRIESVTVRNMGNGVRTFHPFQLQSVTTSGCRNGVAQFESSGSTISDLLAADCEIGVLSGVGASNLLVNQCVFSRNSFSGVAINQTVNAIIANCQFIDDSGIQFSSNAEGSITDCVINGASASISIAIGSNVTMTNCTIGESPINVTISTSSHLTGSGNVLRGGGVTTMRFSGSSTADFHGNHILRNGNAPIVETAAYGIEPVQIDLTGNYWGSSNRDSIDAWTLDGEDLDDPLNPNFRNFSEILFEPFEAQPIPTEKQSVGGLKGRYRSPE